MIIRVVKKCFAKIYAWLFDYPQNDYLSLHKRVTQLEVLVLEQMSVSEKLLRIAQKLNSRYSMRETLEKQKEEEEFLFSLLQDPEVLQNPQVAIQKHPEILKILPKILK